ncbi:hypothetical protein [Povalibacter sp.]|uniref:hypothetical protein n=1 Tax=Povalibacter sp. TaxID=1962978 RepID=UPI002F427473
MHIGIIEILAPLRIEVEEMETARCIDGADLGIAQQLEVSVENACADATNHIGGGASVELFLLHPRTGQHQIPSPSLDSLTGGQRQVFHQRRGDGRLVEEAQP